MKAEPLPWTPEEQGRAVDLHNAGYNGSAIADLMNRTKDGVNAKLLKLRKAGKHVFLPNWERPYRLLKD